MATRGRLRGRGRDVWFGSKPVNYTGKVFQHWALLLGDGEFKVGYEIDGGTVDKRSGQRNTVNGAPWKIWSEQPDSTNLHKRRKGGSLGGATISDKRGKPGKIGRTTMTRRAIGEFIAQYLREHKTYKFVTDNCKRLNQAQQKTQ